MKQKRYPKFKAYFYQGFTKPELLATSVTGLSKVWLSDSYAGDKTFYVKEAIEAFKKDESVENLKAELEEFGIFIDPTFEDFAEWNRSWGLDEETYLEEFLPSKKVYDDFMKYPEYKNKFIAENSIRHSQFDTVYAAFDTYEDLENYVDENRNSEGETDMIMLAVDEKGRAYYPEI